MQRKLHNKLSLIDENPFRRLHRPEDNELKLQGLAHSLNERVKELNCLYGISRLLENHSIDIESILQYVVSLIPAAWQYPDITCARIKLPDKEFKTANFKETVWIQSQNIFVDGSYFGVLEIFYLEKKPDCDEGPFLKEERNLIQVIAERLGNIISHKIDESNLQNMYQREKKLHRRLELEMQRRVDLTRKVIHELKTPLTSLLASSQLLYDEEPNNKLKNLAKHIWDSADSLNNRIEELHDVTKGEMGKLNLKLKPVDLTQLIHSLVDETEALFQQYEMSLKIDIEEPIPVFMADPDRIRQVILNLINNACKYARNGKRVIIRVRKKPDVVLLEVKDYGPGISEAIISALFEPGYRYQEREDLSGGFGIGLILCKMLVELHGGEIWLKSKIGKGTSIFLTLPLNNKEIPD